MKEETYRCNLCHEPFVVKVKCPHHLSDSSAVNLNPNPLPFGMRLIDNGTIAGYCVLAFFAGVCLGGFLISIAHH